MPNTIQIKRRTDATNTNELGTLSVGELGVDLTDSNKLYVGTSSGNVLTGLPIAGGTLTGDLEVQTASGGELLIERSGNSGVLLQQKNNGADNSGSLKFQSGTSTIFTAGGTDILTLTSTGGTLTGDLGVTGWATLGSGGDFGRLALENNNTTAGTTYLQQTYSGTPELRIGSNVGTHANASLIIKSGNAAEVKAQGNLTVGGSLYLTDTNTRLHEGGGNSLRITTNSGYVDIGPMNSSYSHFQTDLGKFYFNKALEISGRVIPYTNNTYTLGTSGFRWSTIYGTAGNFAGSFSINNSGTTSSTFYTDVGNYGDTQVLFEHTGASTPIPFALKKSGYSGNSRGFGILHLDMAHSTVGGGANLHFTLRDSASNKQEYAGIGGYILDNTSGSEDGALAFYTTVGGSVRQQKMTLDGNGLTVAGTGNFSSNLTVGGTATVQPSAGDGILTLENSAASQILRIDQNSIRTTTTHNITLFTNGNSNQLRLSSDGRVGIGVASPSAKLEIAEYHQTTGPVIRLSNTHDSISAGGTHGAIEFFSGDNSNPADQVVSSIKSIHVATAPNYGELAFHTGSNAEAMRIDSTQRVGIGCDPSAKLHINNGSSAGAGAVYPIRLSGGDELSTAGDSTGIQFVQRNQHNDYGGYVRLTNTASTPSYLNPRLEFGVQNNNTNALGSVTTKMVLDGNGRCGIGTTSPLTNSKLTVNGGLAVGDATYTSNMNNGAADFSVDCNGTSMISWIGNYLQVGGTGQNWNMKMYNGLLQTWGNDLTITGGGTGTAYKLYLGTNGQTQTITCNNGSVGIGTTSPGAKLEVNNSSTPFIRVRYDASYYTDYDTNGIRFAGTSQNFNITDNGSSVLYLKSGGNVGIGTTSPSQKLHVVGKALITDDIQLTGSSPRIDFNTNGSSSLRFYDTTNSAERMRIDANGRVGIGTTSPLDLLHITGSTRADFKLEGGYTSGTTDVGKFTFAYTPRGGDTNNRSIAGISAYNTTTDSTSGGFIVFSTRDTNSSSSERMRIKSDGNVGIGTASPANKLTITDGATPYTTANVLLQIKRNASNGNDDTSRASIILANNSNGFHIAYGGTTDRLRFIDGGNNEVLTLKNGGNVGIGTPNPSTKLHVAGAITTTDKLNLNYFGTRILDIQSTEVISRPTSNGSEIALCDAANGYWQTLTLHTDGSERVRVNSSGNVGIGTTSPSAKLHVNGSDDFLAYFKSSDNKAYIAIADDDTTGYISAENDILSLGANTGVNANNLNINTSNNRVGIGTASPNSELFVANGELMVDYASGGSSGGAAMRIATNGNQAFISSNAYYDSSVARVKHARTAASSLIGFMTDATRGGDIVFETSPSASAGANMTSTERMTIKQAGNVGIGTTSPFTNLTVYGATDSRIALVNSNTGTSASDGFVLIAESDSDVHFLNREDSDMFFSTNGTKKMTILSNGRVGIGTAAPEGIVHIEGGSSAPALIVNSTTSSNSARIRIGTGSVGAATDNGAQLIYQGTSTNKFNISNTGAPNSSISLTTRQSGGASVEAVLIDSSQRVGIGVTPSARLHIKDSVDTSLTSGLVIERSADAAKSYINTKGGATTFNNHNAAESAGLPYRWYTDGTHRMSLTTTGLGIGHTNPSSKIYVYGGSKFFGGGDWTNIERVTTTDTNFSLYVTSTSTASNQGIARFSHSATAGSAGSGTETAVIARDKSYFNSKLGVGTADPSIYQFYVNGTSRFINAGLFQNDGSGANDHSELNIFKNTGDNNSSAILRVGYDSNAAFSISRQRASSSIYLNSAQSGSTVYHQVNEDTIFTVNGSNVLFYKSAEFDAGIKDKDGSLGTNGHVLHTNGSDVYWAAASASGSGTVSSSTTTSSTTDGEVAIYTDSTTVKQAAKLYYNGSDDSLTIGQTSSASGASSTNPLYVNGGVRASTFMDKGSTTYWLKPAGDSGSVSGQLGGGLFCYGLYSDVSAPSGFAGIYGKYVSSTVRLFAADGYHNTQISPHNEDGDWEFNSTNTRTKKRTRINMTKLIRKIEELTGEEFIIEDFVE